VVAQVAHFFRDLRRNFRFSQPEAARRLGTTIDIISALEAGDVSNLPPWPETCRIVQAYTGFARLDPVPVLRLIEMLQIRMGRSPTPPQDYEDEGGLFARMFGGMRDAWQGGLGRAVRVLVAMSIPVALVVLVTQTAVLEAAVAKLPPPVARIVRGAQNFIIVQLAPVRDGLRWIDVPDPRSRRGDKLPSNFPSD
jgi:transcriptional regulator with XRE-family HTH domain